MVPSLILPFSVNCLHENDKVDGLKTDTSIQKTVANSRCILDYDYCDNVLEITTNENSEITAKEFLDENELFSIIRNPVTLSGRQCLLQTKESS